MEQDVIKELVLNIWNLGVLGLGLVVALYCYCKYKHTRSRPLLNSIPGVFTSLGLLGTFFSIVYSLYGLDPEFDIIQIVKRIIPAFTSSIVGLICALITTIVIKRIFAQEDADENKSLLEVTPEEYIRDIAERMSDIIKQQKDQGEKDKEYNRVLNENISNQSAILKAFIESFVNRMDDLFDRMRGAIEQQVQNFGEEQFKRTSELLTDITERLSRVSEGLINKQSESVEVMMSKTNEEIEDITSSVTKELDKLMIEIQNSLMALHTQQSEHFGSIFSKVQEHNEQSLRQMIDLRTGYQKEISEVLESTLNMNKEATNDFRNSIKDFVDDIQNAIETQCNALSEAINKNVESLNTAYKFIESLVAEIRQNYDQAVLSYSDAVNVAHRTNESSEKVIAATNTSLEAVEMTNDKIARILDILTERQDNIEQLTKQIHSMSATIEELQKLESLLNKIASENG